MTIAEQTPEPMWTRPFILLLLLSFLGYISLYLILPVIPGYVKVLGGSEAETGAIIGIFSATALLVRPWAGLLADRKGTRIAILLGISGLSLASLAYLPAQAIVSVLTVRVMHGIGWGLFSASVATLAAQLAPASRRATALAYLGMTGSLGLSLGPIIGTALGATTIGFTTAAGLAMLGALCAAMLPRMAPARPTAGLRIGGLISRGALLPAGVLLTHMMTYGAVLTFLPLLVAERGLGNPGWFFTAYAGALFLLRTVAGALSDRLGRIPLLIPGLLLSAGSILLLAVSHDRLTLVTSAVLYAAGHSALQPVVLAWATDRTAATERGAAVSTVVAAQDLGISIGSFLAGFGANAFGLSGVFLAVGLVPLGGLALLFLAVRRSRKVLRAGLGD